MRRKLSDIGRFSDASFLILASLASGPKHGYAMIEDIFEFSGTRLEAGSLYGAIPRLEEKGLVEPLPSEDRRRPYQITPTGIATLREQVATLEQIASASKRRLTGLGGDIRALGTTFISP